MHALIATLSKQAQENIAAVVNLKEKTIADLKKEQEEVRELLAKGLPTDETSAIITQEIMRIESEHGKIMVKIQDKEKIILEKKQSIDMTKDLVTQLDE